MAGPAGALGARHPDVARLRRLLRRRADRAEVGRFVVEGPTLVGEALTSGATVHAVYADGPSPVVDLALSLGVPVRELAPGVLARIADTVTPQGLLAEVDSPVVALDALVGLDFALVCVDLADPGNAGTILRSADAAGAGAVIFGGSSVDVTNPKTVRASAGSLFHVPVVVEPDPLPRLSGLTRIAAVAHGGRPYDEVDLAGAVALVVGNEAHGLADLRHVDEQVTIPMAGRAESLNVGMAASILAFEVLRQRRRAGVSGSA
jgi:TrmH family RNA methyltransferase